MPGDLQVHQSGAAPLPIKPSTEALVQWSLSGLLAIVFPKSRSTAFPAALALAERADLYEVQQAGKAVYHVAGFGRSEGQAARALEMMRLLRGLKGVQVFVRGALSADPWRLQRTLECYLASCGSADPRAHCVVMVSDDELRHGLPSSVSLRDMGGRQPPPGLEWVKHIGMRPFPCRMVKEYGFRLQPGHPASEADQIQAAAVRVGCNWCPNFNQGKERP